MTHLNAFSYIDRGLGNMFTLIATLMIIVMFKEYDTFTCGGTGSGGKLKAIAATMQIISMVLFVIYDIMVTAEKYRCFEVEAAGGSGCLDTTLMDVADFIFSTTITLKTSSTFLLIASFNHSISVRLKKSFVSTNEFRFYWIYSCVSVVMYPIMKIIFLGTSDRTMSVVAPQLVYLFEGIFLMACLQYTSFRFKKVVSSMSYKSRTWALLSKYRILLNLLTLAFFLENFGLGSLNIDFAIHGREGALYQNPFWKDLFTKIFNLGVFLYYPVVLLILFPKLQLPNDNEERKSRGISKGSKGSNNTTQGAIKLSTTGSSPAVNKVTLGLGRNTEGYEMKNNPRRSPKPDSGSIGNDSLKVSDREQGSSEVDNSRDLQKLDAPTR